MRYSLNPDPEKTARALLRDAPVKPKHAVNVCRAIKGKAVESAKVFLKAVVAGEQAVPFLRHKRNVNHRTGMGPGLYPRDASKAILALVESAASNAEYKGLDPEKMFISHVAAHRAKPIPGTMQRAQGRATPWNTSTSHIEIVLAEREPEEGEEE